MARKRLPDDLFDAADPLASTTGRRAARPTRQARARTGRPKADDLKGNVELERLTVYLHRRQAYALRELALQRRRSQGQRRGVLPLAREDHR